MTYRTSAATAKVKGLGLNMFSEDELYSIHMATLQVLEKTGIKVTSKKALKTFENAGCFVKYTDEENGIVKFPGYVIEECIASAPKKVVLYGRDEKNNVILEDKRVHFTNFGEGVSIIDPYTGKLRDTVKQDCADTARICDALEEIDIVLRAVAPHDIHPELHPIAVTDACFSNTTKPIFIGGVHRSHAPYLMEMAAAVAGSKEQLTEKPLMAINVCPTSPLQLTEHVCETIIACAEYGIPVNYISMAMCGATSPITLGGTLVTHNCEVLAGIALNQLTTKGAPVIYGSSTTMMDLKTTTAPVGCPEFAMINAAVAVLAQFYNLPSWVAGG